MSDIKSKVINDYENCTGCGACAQICPKSAINMLDNHEGFLYPDIDNKLCVKCNKCVEVCPLGKTELGGDELATIVAYAKEDEVRISSSSGGVFFLLAKYIFKCSGVVYGAYYDEKLRVKHCRVDSKENIWMLQKSKYVQSEIGRSYIEAEEDLNSGRFVLFVGTPCQIAGLKSYLQNENYTRLVTVEVLCHGVPSPKLFEKYIDVYTELAGRKVTSVDFRDKKDGWKDYSICIKCGEETEYRLQRREDSYIKMFLSDYSLRSSCYSCEFKNAGIADITIGDAWGIEKINVDLFDNKGTSAIICNTESGIELINKICNQLVYEEIESAILKSCNGGYTNIIKKPFWRNQLFNSRFGEMDFNEICASLHLKGIKNDLQWTKRDVAIWGAGNALQYYYQKISENANVRYIVDSDSTKWGQYINGIECISPEQLWQKDKLFVIITIINKDYIYQFLELLTDKMYEFDSIERWLEYV